MKIVSKICKDCLGVFGPENFYKHKHAVDGLQLRCKQCEKKRRKLRYASMTTDAKSNAKRWRNDNLARSKATNKTWRQANPHKIREYSMRYEGAICQASNLLTASMRSEIKIIYEHARDCGMLTGDSYHVDHIVPLRGENVCGLHVPWNLQVLPSDINESKGNSFV